MSKRLTTRILALALTLALLSLFPIQASPVFADPGLNVGGAYVITNISADDIYVHTMAVSTKADDPPMDIEIEVLGYGQGLDGVALGLPAEEDASIYSARDYVELDNPSFTLQPGESKDVVATITIPSDVGSGGRYAIIQARTSPTGTGDIQIIQVINIPVAITITGTQLSHAGEIRDLSVAELTTGEPVSISLSLQNTGNHHYKAKAEAILKSAEGDILGTVATPLSASSIIPTWSRQFQFTLIPDQELALGTYTLECRVVLDDATVVDNQSTSFTIAETYVPPAVSGVSISDVSHTGATVRWTTNKPTTSQVEYGLTTDYGFYTDVDSDMATDHEIPLSDLAPNTTYHFRVRSMDVTENEVMSEDDAFTTFGMVVVVSLPTTASVSADAEATDSQGNSLSIPGNAITTVLTPDNQTKFILPVALPADGTLASFTDPATGMSFANNKLTIPIYDSGGNQVGQIVADVKETKGTGTTAELVVDKMKLKTEDSAADFSTLDPEVGKVAASLEVNLKSIPGMAHIKVIVSKAASPEVQTVLLAAADEAGLEIADIAYIIDVQKINLTNQTHLGETIITLKVGKAWADKYGTDRMRVIRYTDTGEGQVLHTTFQGYQGNFAVFQATTTDGLSIFALTALPPVHVNWTYIIGGIAGGVVLIALSVYFFIIRPRRSKDRALRRRWPTGLEPEDWQPE